MTRSLILLLLCVLSCFCAAQETRVKAGDTLTVVTAGQPQYSGDFIVNSDGAINVQVYGKFKVSGKLLNAIQREVQLRAREYVRDANVTVILKAELQLFVYLVSEKVTDGAIPWAPGLDLRQLMAKHPNLLPLDTYDARLYRQGKSWRTVNLVKLMQLSDETENTKLEPGDVLTLLPSASMAVWVVGAVASPGQVHIREGEGPAHAIALAGGQTPDTFSSTEMTVTLRRGNETLRKSMAEVLQGSTWELQAGDTIAVERPRLISVTVGGLVVAPGEYKVREGTNFVPAIESAGGLKLTGTLEKAVLFRKGKGTVIDARSLKQGGTDVGVSLEDGDFIFVPENRREYHVLGYVAKPGSKLIPDSHDIKLTDALAATEGLKPNGTYRGAVVLRADEKGNYVAKRYDLDRYIKGGDQSQNPRILSGDIVFFDQTRGTTLNDILKLVPSLLLLDSFF